MRGSRCYAALRRVFAECSATVTPMRLQLWSPSSNRANEEEPSMPILYIHGVATRSRDGFVEIERYLRRLVAPAISPDPDGVLIDDVFWGDVAATFFWDGASRPRSRLLGQGADGPQVSALENVHTATAFADAFSRLPATPSPAPATGGLIAGGATPASTGRAPLRLKDLSP